MLAFLLLRITIQVTPSLLLKFRKFTVLISALASLSTLLASLLDLARFLIKNKRYSKYLNQYGYLQSMLYLLSVMKLELAPQE